uniref:SID1 transmembrane family member 2 n=1 Tax=Erpetoichthys calabaricus TaxID=27687 RepID=A0A8C4RTG0_ERPCA
METHEYYSLTEIVISYCIYQKASGEETGMDSTNYCRKFSPYLLPSACLAIFGLIMRPKDFASYLLGIFICNLLLYLAFYIIMKLRSLEKIRTIPSFCIIATAVLWAAALYFFFQNLTSWEETPAESRELNRDCSLLHFFDDHDIWHFLSATAMFFSFLVSVLGWDVKDSSQVNNEYI